MELSISYIQGTDMEHTSKFLDFNSSQKGGILIATLGIISVLSLLAVAAQTLFAIALKTEMVGTTTEKIRDAVRSKQPNWKEGREMTECIPVKSNETDYLQRTYCAVRPIKGSRSLINFNEFFVTSESCPSEPFSRQIGAALFSKRTCRFDTPIDHSITALGNLLLKNISLSPSNQVQHIGATGNLTISENLILSSRAFLFAGGDIKINAIIVPPGLSAEVTFVSASGGISIKSISGAFAAFSQGVFFSAPVRSFPLQPLFPPTLHSLLLGAFTSVPN